MLQLGMNSNVILGDGEVIRGGKAFLFGSIFRIGLNVHSEYFSGDGGNDLVSRYRTISTDRMSAHREGARRTNVGIERNGQRSFMFNTQSEVEAGTLAGHVF